MKGKQVIKVTNGFQKISYDSILVNHKPDKILLDKVSEFDDESMKSLLQDNNIKIYLRHNKGEYNIAETFIRTLKPKFTNILRQYQKMCVLIN